MAVVSNSPSVVLGLPDVADLLSLILSSDAVDSAEHHLGDLQWEMFRR